MNILSVIVVAVVAESLWETLKMVWQDGKFSYDRIGSLIVGVLLALGANLDLFTLVGIDLNIPLLGMLLTGILISRGSNFIHDLLATIGNIKEITK